MKKLMKTILSIGIAVSMCFGVIAIERSASTEVILTDAAIGTYYAPITAKSGTALLAQVHDLITKTHTTYTTYNNCRDYGPKTDPGLDGKGALEFYTHETVMSFSGTAGTWNREHVWCQSLSNGMWGTDGGGSDMHHIRPSEATLNSKRGNNKYGVATGSREEAYSKTTSGTNSKLGGHLGGGAFEPLDNVKGDVARIVMYVYTHYNSYKNSIFGGLATTNGSGGKFGTLNFTHVMMASNEDAAIKLLLEWNKKDPVDPIETYRNEEVYKIQGNRNPFIDHPEYADAIWGGASIDPTPPSTELKSISLNKTSFSLNVGGSTTLTVTPNPSNANASVSWASSDSSVASVSASGVVTAKKEGTAKITATSIEKPSIQATATVTVKQSGATVEGSVTINRDSFAVTDKDYTFYSWSEGGVRGTAYIYGGNGESMQFTNKKDSHYLASSTPTPAPIKSITVKSSANEGQYDRTWRLLTSNSPYSEVQGGNPTAGVDQGIKTVTSSGVTWDLNGNDTYFALVYELEGAEGAAYLTSITITYGSEGGGDEKHVCQSECNTCHKCTDQNCSDPACSEKCLGHSGGEGDNTNLNAFREAVANINSRGNLQDWLVTINEAISVYQALTESEKAQVSEEIEDLRLAIDNYNDRVRAYNEAAQKANNALNRG